MSDDPNTHVFSRPVRVIDKTVDSVTLREPTGADLKKAGDPANSVAYSQRLAEILANFPTGTLDTVPARDVVALGRIVGRFLQEPEPPTSSTDTSSAPVGGTTQAGPSA